MLAKSIISKKRLLKYSSAECAPNEISFRTYVESASIITVTMLRIMLYL